MNALIARAIGGLLGLTFLALAGCTTVQPARVSEFGRGVDTVKLQLDTTFAAVNQMATQDEIDRAVTQPTLKEEDVGVVLKREDIAKWDRAMAEIDLYVANLVLLLSPDHAKEFDAAAQALGTQAAALDAHALPSAGVAAGFAELGRLLIEAKAESGALQAARKADPAMQSIFVEMAAAIGENNQKGLRGTVWEHWKERMAVQQLAFLKLKPEARREIVIAYIDLRDKRDAQDLQFGSLRQSLLDLAAAHGALARGSDTGVTAAIGMIQQELDATRALFDHFNSLQPKAEGKQHG